MVTQVVWRPYLEKHWLRRQESEQSFLLQHILGANHPISTLPMSKSWESQGSFWEEMDRGWSWKVDKTQKSVNRRKYYGQEASNLIRWESKCQERGLCLVYRWCLVNDPSSHALLHRSLPCHTEGVCITQWSYDPCWVRPPKMDRSQWRVLTKRDPLEEGMANHPQYTCCDNLWILSRVCMANMKSNWLHSL